jgi:hypothetical protein
MEKRLAPQPTQEPAISGIETKQNRIDLVLA